MEGFSVKKNAMRALSALAVTGLALTGCGGSDQAGGAEKEKFTQVKMSYDNDDFMNQMTWMVADQNYWPKLGFTEPADVTASDEYMAALTGGDVWIAQGESDAIWAAMAQGSVPLTIVGVIKDKEAWWLGVAKGVDPNNLAGRKISGGPIGDRNVTVAKKMLQERGVDPDSMDFVSIPGGSDDRLTALLAGQIDVAVLQPRHLAPLEANGGQMIVKEYSEVPQETWVVRSDTLKDHKDEVCAYVQGRVEALQYVSAGENHTANEQAILQIVRDRGLDPSKDEIAEWPEEMTNQLALDGGASAQSFDQWNQDMIDNGNVPKGFDWRAHADFSCLTAAQEKLGLKPDPGNI
jgi:ABC-type nitrate/sulfonate/bicarbonate transport system substrate-binding protein